MLDLTADAEVDGVRFDGFDLFLFEPHVDIDATDDQLKRLADKARARNLEIGSVVAPVWPPTGGGSAMGDADDRKRFLDAGVEGLPHRPSGSASWAFGPTAWCGSIRPAASRPGAKTRKGNQRRIAETFREACKIAEDHDERLAAEGEICWGGMHSWRRMIELLEMVDRPQTLGFQADMAHTLLYLLGYNAPEDALLPQDFDWQDRRAVRRGLRHADRGVAAVDDRLPRGPERRDGPRRRLARQDRPALPGQRSRTASSTSSATPATGCATPPAS